MPILLHRHFYVSKKVNIFQRWQPPGGKLKLSHHGSDSMFTLICSTDACSKEKKSGFFQWRNHWAESSNYHVTEVIPFLHLSAPRTLVAKKKKLGFFQWRNHWVENSNCLVVDRISCMPRSTT